MAFQFAKDKSNALMLTLSGDVDLEITPEIKAQLATQVAKSRARRRGYEHRARRLQA